MKFKSAQIIFSLLLIWAAARFCHHQTAGFRITKLIHNSSPFKSQTPPPLSKEEKAGVDQLLSQKFTYLGRGLQSFAFLSEDGTTVLKIFNNRYQKRFFFLKLLPPLPFSCDKWRKKKLCLTREKLSKVFYSYELANEKLREESGLIYLHLRGGDDHFAKTTIIDKLNIAHPLDLNDKGFLLQKKATLVFDYFTELKKEGQTDAAKESLTSLIGLIRTKMQRQIADSDPLIRANLGFVESKPIQIDLGPLSPCPSYQDPALRHAELISSTLSLRHWLENHYPELLPTYYEEIEVD